MKTIYSTINRTQMNQLVEMVKESLKDVGEDDVGKEMFDEAVLMLIENVGGLELLDDDDVYELCREMYVIYLNN